MPFRRPEERRIRYMVGNFNDARAERYEASALERDFREQYRRDPTERERRQIILAAREQIRKNGPRY